MKNFTSMLYNEEGYESKEVGAGGRFDFFLDSAYRKRSKTELQMVVGDKWFYRKFFIKQERK